MNPIRRLPIISNPGPGEQTPKPIQNLHFQELSHIYLTGDIPPHDVWKSDEKEYFNITKTVYDLLSDRFAVKVFPVIGNHEAVPPNLFSSEQGASPTLRKTPQLYSNLASFWSPWLGEEQFRTVRKAL